MCRTLGGFTEPTQPLLTTHELKHYLKCQMTNKVSIHIKQTNCPLPAWGRRTLQVAATWTPSSPPQKPPITGSKTHGNSWKKSKHVVQTACSTTYILSTACLISGEADTGEYDYQVYGTQYKSAWLKKSQQIVNIRYKDYFWSLLILVFHWCYQWAGT